MTSSLLPLGIPWHPKQRLYLYASHGLVWLSDAKGCVLLNQESGLAKGQLKYPHYQRILPELDSLTEDTSPYAQTGYSIWSIRMFNSRSLTVVHDIERCSPTKGLEGKDESFKNFECFLESFFQKTHSL